MKKFLLLIFCMAAMLTSYAQPPASYDFEAPDMHGNTLRYKITDATRNQVKMVQLKGTINGPLDIPAQVENGGVTYNVVGAVGFFLWVELQVLSRTSHCTKDWKKLVTPRFGESIWAIAN